MIIAIPTYKRTSLLNKSTLPLLLNSGFSRDEIYIFVSGEDEYLDYIEKFPDFNIIMGDSGIHGIHNSITDYFLEGQEIIRMDDDITKIDGACPQMLRTFFTDAFAYIKENNLKYWGVYPQKWEREQLRLPEVSTGLMNVMGMLVGHINRKAMKIPSEVRFKEEVYRCLWYYENGGICRFNRINVRTRFYREGSGLSIERNIDNEKLSALAVYKIFPKYLTIQEKKGRTQFRFKRLPLEPECCPIQ